MINNDIFSKENREAFDRLIAKANSLILITEVKHQQAIGGASMINDDDLDSKENREAVGHLIAKAFQAGKTLEEYLNDLSLGDEGKKAILEYREKLDERLKGEGMVEMGFSDFFKSKSIEPTVPEKDRPQIIIQSF